MVNAWSTVLVRFVVPLNSSAVAVLLVGGATPPPRWPNRGTGPRGSVAPARPAFEPGRSVGRSPGQPGRRGAGGQRLQQGPRRRRAQLLRHAQGADRAQVVRGEVPGGEPAGQV